MFGVFDVGFAVFGDLPVGDDELVVGDGGGEAIGEGEGEVAVKVPKLVC